MKKTLLLLLVICMGLMAYSKNETIICKGNLKFDFSFAELAVQYLESGDTAILSEIADLGAVEHIMNHAKKYAYRVPKSSNRALVEYLLCPIDDKKQKLPKFKKSLQFAKEQVEQDDFIHFRCLEFLPKDFQYSGSLYFTFGYDLGVVFGENASVNLAHSHYLNNPKEIRYYMLHELHHAGFFECRNKPMPEWKIETYADAVEIIELATHLEGMATYVPLGVRQKENAMDSDKDYICLNDSLIMSDLEKEYFRIYNHFLASPEKKISDEDWDLIACLSDGKRLWYRVGAHMAKNIDEQLGRDLLVELIQKEPKEFVTCYQKLRKNRR